MTRPLLALGLLAAGLLPSIASAAASGAAPAITPTVSTISLPQAYDPSKGIVAGSTDNYHCSLLDPHLTTDSYLLSSELLPDKVKEVHHAILFMVTPSQAALARSLDQKGKGWTCFGAPLNPSGSFDGTPWLGAWVPGHGPNVFTKGTGIPMPAGSLIVMQMHYNLLNGASPDQSKVRISTVPQKGSSLAALSIREYPAPPDLPCPTGVTGPLCDRKASLQDLGRRFGQSAIDFVNGIEFVCRNQHDWTKYAPSRDQVGTSCDWGLTPGSIIRSVTPHMHLLGASSTISVVNGSKTTTLAHVEHYNFDQQVSYDLATPYVVKPGDQLKVSCKYTPTLRQRLEETSKLPARYITWGDGSSDEMCLAIVSATGA